MNQRTPNEEIRDRAFAEAWLRDHPHEALITCIDVLMTRYNLTLPQAHDLIRQYVFCAANRREPMGNGQVMIVPPGTAVLPTYPEPTIMPPRENP